MTIILHNELARLSVLRKSTATLGVFVLSWGAPSFADGRVTTAGQAMLFLVAALLLVGMILGAIAALVARQKSGATVAWVWFFSVMPVPLLLFFLHLWIL